MNVNNKKGDPVSLLSDDDADDTKKRSALIINKSQSSEMATASSKNSKFKRKKYSVSSSSSYCSSCRTFTSLLSLSLEKLAIIIVSLSIFSIGIVSIIITESIPKNNNNSNYYYHKPLVDKTGFIVLPGTKSINNSSVTNNSSKNRTRRIYVNDTNRITVHNIDSNLVESITNDNENFSSSTAFIAIDKSQQQQQQQQQQYQQQIGNVNIYDNDTLLPNWMKEYILWHKEKRKLLLNETNYDILDKKLLQFIVMKCMKNEKCGGVTDRLRPIPAILRLAYDTKRILLIKWDSNPSNLEDYLLPPEDGIDWRIPPWLCHKLKLYSPKRTGLTTWERIYTAANTRTKRFVICKLQTFHYGTPYYNERASKGASSSNSSNSSINNESTVDHLPLDTTGLFRSIWYKVFTPTPNISKLIEYHMEQLKLLPGKYTAVHARVLYGQSSNNISKIESLVKNAINCTSKILYENNPSYYENNNMIDDDYNDDDSEPTIFFASDSSDAVHIALKYGTENGFNIVVRSDPNSTTDNNTSNTPLHVGMQHKKTINSTASTNTTSDATTSKPFDPTSFYDTFVDIYLIGLSKCSSYGAGGFGRWGILLGYNNSCQINHWGQRGFECEFIEKVKNKHNKRKVKQKNPYETNPLLPPKPWFPKPMI